MSIFFIISYISDIFHNADIFIDKKQEIPHNLFDKNPYFCNSYTLFVSIFYTMNRLFLILQLFLLTILLSPAPATAYRQFHQLTTSQGLGDNTIYTVIQDSLGFIWIGGIDGLYRYDGQQLTAIRKNFFQPTGRGNMVTSITEDRTRQRLWCVVNQQLFSVHLKTDSITQECVGNTQYAFRHVLSDKKGRIWLTLINGKVALFHPESRQIQECTQISALRHTNVFHIRENNNGTLDFLTSHNGIYRYDTNSGHIWHFPFHECRAIVSLTDSQGNLWLGTLHGLYKWDTEKNEFRSIPLGNNQYKAVFTINDLTEQTPGIICAGTDSGLFFYNDHHQTYEHYTAAYAQTGALNCNYINSLYTDREHNLWVSTYFGGVNYTSPYNHNFRTYEDINKKMGGHVVSSFAEDTKGGLWISTEDGGIYYLNRKSRHITAYNPQEAQQPMIDFFNVHALLFDNNNLYIGLAGRGVSIYNTLTQKATILQNQLQKTQHLSSDYIYALHKFGQNHIAIGSTNGLDLYNPHNGNIEKVQDIPNSTVNCILQDCDGKYWLCGKEMGVYFLQNSGKWEKFPIREKGLPTPVVYTLAEHNRILYFGTQDYGIIAYHRDSQTFKHLLDSELNDVIVYKIIPDSTHLWISTTKGLYRYHTITEKIERFTEDNGLNSRRFVINSGIRTNDGTLFFGSFNGLIGFKPEQLKFNPTSPRTVFTRLKVANQTITPQSAGSPLTNTITYSPLITLPHNDAGFSLEMATLSYGRSRHLFRYKMQPGNNEWIYTTSNTLNFNNLNPGKYQLTISGCNNEGTWDEKGSTLHIHLLPPWWLSRYMYWTYTLALIALFAGLARWFKKQQKRKIEKLQLQKEQEIYRSKMEFFTQIIHDIRTPLTLICGPLELLRQHTALHPFHHELDIISRNSKQLLNRVNQLMELRKSEAATLYPSTFQTICVATEIKAICSEFELIARQNGISITVTTEQPDTEILIHTHRESFHKIFSNIISNAVKFARQKITVIIHAADNKKQCCISIEDDGCGIPPQQHEQIFTPFFQGNNSTQKGQAGTGIGLSIVRNLAKQLKASLQITSDGKNTGTVFTVIFPIEEIKIQPPTSSTLNLIDDIEPAAPARNVQWNIAVIEDNCDMRDFLSSVLLPHFRTECFPDADSFTTQLLHRQFDLIVSDIMMPGIDGLQLCKIIKQNPDTSHIPVILLTAKATDQDQMEGLRLGADAYISKPFSPELLVARIENIIENRKRLADRFYNEPDTKLTDILPNKDERNFITKMDAIIMQNLQNPEFSSQLMSQELGICRTLLFSKIKAISGMSFSHYVRLQRLKKSVEFMKEHDYPMTTIAEMTGFSSLSYFSRCFKEYFHLSPLEYLKKVRQKEETEPSATNETDKDIEGI